MSERFKLESQYMQAYVIRGRSYMDLHMDNKALDGLTRISLYEFRIIMEADEI